MSQTTLDDYVPPAQPEGDRVSPSDLTGRTLIVQPLKVAEGIETKYGPKDGISVNVADILNDDVYLNVLWFNAAIVDGLRESLGKTLAIELVERTAKNGNTYIAVDTVVPEQKTKAGAWLSAHPTAFAPPMDDPAPKQAQPAQPAAPAASGETADVEKIKTLIAAGLDDPQIAGIVGCDPTLPAAIRNVL